MNLTAPVNELSLKELLFVTESLASVLESEILGEPRKRAKSETGRTMQSVIWLPMTLGCLRELRSRGIANRFDEMLDIFEQEMG